MSGFGDVHIVSANVGALSNARRPILKVPSGYGGITVLGAQVISAGSTNSEVRLVRMGSAGTALSGTINTTAVGGTASPFVANIPKACVIANSYVPEGDYIGLQEGSVAAMNAVSIVALSYVMGHP